MCVCVSEKKGRTTKKDKTKSCVLCVVSSPFRRWHFPIRKVFAEMASSSGSSFALVLVLVACCGHAVLGNDVTLPSASKAMGEHVQVIVIERPPTSCEPIQAGDHLTLKFVGIVQETNKVFTAQPEVRFPTRACWCACWCALVGACVLVRVCVGASVKERAQGLGGQQLKEGQ